MAETSDSGVVRQLLCRLIAFERCEPLRGRYQSTRRGADRRDGRLAAPRAAGPFFDKLMRLARAVASFSNQGIDETRPLLSATLPDDERIQIVIPPATTRDTVSITIRKPSLVSLSMADMEEGGLFERVVASANQKQAKIRC